MKSTLTKTNTVYCCYAYIAFNPWDENVHSTFHTLDCHSLFTERTLLRRSGKQTFRNKRMHLATIHTHQVKVYKTCLLISPTDF